MEKIYFNGMVIETPTTVAVGHWVVIPGEGTKVYAEKRIADLKEYEVNQLQESLKEGEVLIPVRDITFMVRNIKEESETEQPTTEDEQFLLPENFLQIMHKWAKKGYHPDNIDYFPSDAFGTPTHNLYYESTGKDCIRYFLFQCRDTFEADGLLDFYTKYYELYQTNPDENAPWRMKMKQDMIEHKKLYDKFTRGIENQPEPEEEQAEYEPLRMAMKKAMLEAQGLNDVIDNIIKKEVEGE